MALLKRACHECVIRDCPPLVGATIGIICRASCKVHLPNPLISYIADEKSAALGTSVNSCIGYAVFEGGPDSGGALLAWSSLRGSDDADMALAA